jgi:hypothetical protein
LGFDYWEYFERAMCIWSVALIVWKLYVWKQKQIVKKVIRGETTKKFSAGSVAEVGDFHGNLQMAAKWTSKPEMVELGVSEPMEVPEEAVDGQMLKRKRRRPKWY